MMTKWELKEQLESLRETNSKLTEANLVIAKQLENLWSEVGYKNDRVRDLTYEAEFKRIEREYNKKNNPKPFYKQPTLKDKPTRKPDALPPGTETVKMQKEPEPPFDLAKYIKEEADKKLKAEQENFDKQYGQGGIPSLYRPI